MKKCIVAFLISYFLVLNPLNCSDFFPKDIYFHVYRNNDLIGFHKINFTRESDSSGIDYINANIEINFEVKFLGFVIYKYFHLNREKWKITSNEYENKFCTNCNGNFSLEKLESITNKNGNQISCLIKNNKKVLVAKTNINNEKISSNLYTLTSSYWDPNLVFRIKDGDTFRIEKERLVNKKFIYNTQDCSLIDLRIEKKTKENIYDNLLTTNRYKLTGKESSGGNLDIDIWYDENGNWVKMTFLKDGSIIEYFLDEYHEIKK